MYTCVYLSHPLSCQCMVDFDCNHNYDYLIWAIAEDRHWITLHCHECCEHYDDAPWRYV